MVLYSNRLVLLLQNKNKNTKAEINQRMESTDHSLDRGIGSRVGGRGLCTAHLSYDYNIAAFLWHDVHSSSAENR
jgi:hypothetical protein